MRRQLVKTVTDILEKDSRVVLLLGDIGVYGFHEAFARFPARVYNIGILEQASVGLAAGLATEGMIPVFHTIAPFMVERALEQLKVDFGYQGLNGNFVSVGASYDYASLGCTHHCPGDVAVLKSIPNMQIFVPGHPQEFDVLFRQTYGNKCPAYFRLSERSNVAARAVSVGHDTTIREGRLGTVIAVGPMLDAAVEACQDMDVTILYRTSIAPCDDSLLFNRSVVVVEPFYQGTLASDIQTQLGGETARTLSIGVPRRFLTFYGTASEQDKDCGLTSEQLKARIGEFLE